MVYETRTPSTGSATKIRYLPVNGQYLAKVTQDGTNPEYKYFYHTDLVGSVRAVTDISGQLAAHYDYEPFGSRSQTTGWMSGLESHRFTGKPQDGSTTLYNYGARYYSTAQGRFMTPDPVGQGSSSYVYALNNPLRYVDPTGMREDVTGGSPLEEYKDSEGRHVWTGDADYDVPHSAADEYGIAPKPSERANFTYAYEGWAADTLVGIGAGTGAAAGPLKTGLEWYIGRISTPEYLGRSVRDFALGIVTGPAGKLTGKQILRRTFDMMIKSYTWATHLKK